MYSCVFYIFENGREALLRYREIVFVVTISAAVFHLCASRQIFAASARTAMSESAWIVDSEISLGVLRPGQSSVDWNLLKTC